LTRAQPVAKAQQRQCEVNKTKLLAETDFALTHVNYGKVVAQMKSAANGIPRSAKSSVAGIRQGLKVLGIDPLDPSELRSLIALGDRILDNLQLYPTITWSYFCAGYITFNECVECREKTGDRKRFFSEGDAAIAARFIELVESREYRPPKALKV